MRRCSLVLLALTAALLVLPASAGSSRKPDAGVSFHLETTEGENPKTVFSGEMAGKTRYFRKSAELTIRDIVAYSPFPADDGATYGAVCQLSRPATSRLAALSSAYTGSWLLAMVNGRVVDAVVIDKKVEDGFIVIWRGITAPEIKAFDKERPRLGETKKEWKKSQKKS
jgi:hypothetical protein